MTPQLLKRASARRTRSEGAANPAMVLAIILGCYLMVVLDASVVITALPHIRTDLGFSSASLSWVQNAYTLTFGGLLLLGARAGDLLGRRQMFVLGISLFIVASMLGGLAQSETWLLTARAVQGIGAAIARPRPWRCSPSPSPRAPSAPARSPSTAPSPARAPASAWCSAAC